MIESTNGKGFRLFFFAIVACSLASLASAQLTNDELRTIARSKIATLGESLGETATVTRKRDAVRGVQGPPYVVVDDGLSVARLTVTGELLSYGSMDPTIYSRPDGKPDMFATDEEAWQHFEGLIAGLDLPAGLTRSQFESVSSGSGPAALYRLTLLPKPYGYPASGGNIVVCEIRKSSGRLISLYVGRGWSYEPPNIQVSETEAINALVREFGGEPADWQVVLTYATTPDPDGPAELYQLNQDRTMRLCYLCSSEYVGASVDSVTGEIFAVGEHGSSPGGGQAAATGSSVNRTGSAGQTEAQSRKSILPLAMLTIVGLGVVVWLVLRRR